MSSDAVRFYRYGEPQDNPEPWFEKQLADWGIDARYSNIWMLDKTQDFSAPAAYLLEMPPGFVLSRHGHPCERFEVIVRGSLDVGDGRIARPGDIFTAQANTLYGPHQAGPEGCTTIEVFSYGYAMFRMLYEGADGEILEANTRNGEYPPDYVQLPSPPRNFRL